MLPNPKHIRVLPHWLAVIGLFLLDWLSKTIVRVTLAPGVSYPLVGDLLKITYVQNTRGVAWWVPDVPNAAHFILAAVFGVVIFAAYPVYLFYANQHRNSTWAALAFVCIQAAFCGHLLNDIFLPYTVDFLQVYNSPSANFADLYGYAGIIALVVEAIQAYRGQKQPVKGLKAWLEREKAVRDEFLRYYRIRK
ncbi:MAG TPA: signal peptidase II [Anaerolineaceae bacterium]|nr:signal peptidase II [Anaerolineaceae bacterium]